MGMGVISSESRNFTPKSPSMLSTRVFSLCLILTRKLHDTTDEHSLEILLHIID